MDRKTLVNLLVLDSLLDDIESVETILPLVNWKESKRGIVVTTDEIKEHLAVLIGEGLVEALWYSFELKRYDVMSRIPTAEEMDDTLLCWFDLTPQGRIARDRFPKVFDDEGDLVENWREL